MTQESDFPQDPAQKNAYVQEQLAKRLGISQQAAAGVIARLWKETPLEPIDQDPRSRLDNTGQVNPNVPGGTGYGQWTADRRSGPTGYDTYAKQFGLDPHSHTASLEYLINDLQTNYPDLVKELQGAKSWQEAQATMNGYESGTAPRGKAMPGAPQGQGFEDWQKGMGVKGQGEGESTPPSPPEVPQVTTPSPTQSFSDWQKEMGVGAQPQAAQPAVAPAPTPQGPVVNQPQSGPTGILANTGAALVQGGEQGLNLLTNPAQAILHPAAAMGTAAYNYLAPKLGGQALSPEQMEDLLGPQPGQPGTLLKQGAQAAIGAPSAEGVPAQNIVEQGIRTAVPALMTGAMGGPRAALTAGEAALGGQALTSQVPPQYQPGAEAAADLALGAGGQQIGGNKLGLNPRTVQTVQQSEAAGGPKMRLAQMSEDNGAKAKDLADHAAETTQQVKDFTKAFTKQAGLETESADSDWGQKLLNVAKNRLNTVATRTGIPETPELHNDIGGAEAAFYNTAEAADPKIAAQGRKMVDNVLAKFGKNNGITGQDYQDMTNSSSELSTFANTGGQLGILARGLRKAINDQLERSASPEDAAEVRAARTQYGVAKRLEPILDNTSGVLDPQRVAGKFAGDNSDLGKIAAAGKLLPRVAPAGGAKVPGKGIANKLFNNVPAYMAEGAAGAAALYTHPIYSGAAIGLGLLGKGAAVGRNAYLQSDMARNAAMRQALQKGPPNPYINYLLPGVAASQGVQPR